MPYGGEVRRAGEDLLGARPWTCRLSMWRVQEPRLVLVKIPSEGGLLLTCLCTHADPERHQRGSSLAIPKEPQLLCYEKRCFYRLWNVCFSMSPFVLDGSSSSQLGLIVPALWVTSCWVNLDHLCLVLLAGFKTGVCEREEGRERGREEREVMAGQLLNY